MLTYQTEHQNGCQAHGFACPYLQQQQPPSTIVGHSKTITEMYELRKHNCAMIQLFAHIGLLRRSRMHTNLPSDHPCLEPQFYQDFKRIVIGNLNFYLNSSPRTLISILSSIADHDPVDSAVATTALLLSRMEEIVNTCIGFNPWQADPQQFKDACNGVDAGDPDNPPVFKTLGFSHETCATLYALFDRLKISIQKVQLVHQINSELYERLLDPTSGYPYSPSIMQDERPHPNWIQMIAEQTDTKDFPEKIRRFICY